MRPFATCRLLLVLAAFLVSGLAAAQYPSTMNYQVMLTNDLDEPLADQSVELVFRLYELEAGGSAAWTETHDVTTNSIGVVSVVLGSINPLPLFDWLGLFWLETEVDSEVMSPRRRLTSSPYALMSFDTMRLDGEVPSYYATDDELSASGTINSPSNPVDWTMLKNVPSGIADGTDDVGGAGDGHSLDAWDGDPVDAVWVAGQGRLGIGTTAPMATVHAHVDTEFYSGLLLTNQMTGATGGDGLYVGMSPWNEAYISNQEDGPLYLSAGSGHGVTIQPDGTVQIARGSSGAVEFQVYGQPGGLDPLHRSFGDAYGGQFELQDDVGNVALELGADQNGTGGRLIVQRNETFSFGDGIDLNGNWAGTEEPALRILGSSTSAAFDMSATGNSSVVLPSGSVYGYEIMDEPGVASETYNIGVALTTDYGIIRSCSITAPSTGYVQVMASCQISLSKADAVMVDIDLGVSDIGTGFPENQEVAITLPTALPAGSYNFPGTYHGLFQVSSGAHTFYFLGKEYSGNAVVHDVQLSLAFFPTAYGTVVPTLAGRGGDSRDQSAETRAPMTQSEIAAERAESDAADLARIERELAEIRLQVEALKQER